MCECSGGAMSASIKLQLLTCAPVASVVTVPGAGRGRAPVYRQLRCCSHLVLCKQLARAPHQVLIGDGDKVQLCRNVDLTIAVN